MSGSVRVRVAVARGTRVFVEVVELDGEVEGPALSPPTFDTTGESLPSEPPPAPSNVRPLFPSRAA